MWHGNWNAADWLMMGFGIVAFWTVVVVGWSISAFNVDRRLCFGCFGYTRIGRCPMSVSHHLAAADLAGERVTRVRVSARGAKRLGEVVHLASAGRVEIRRGAVHAPLPAEFVEVLRTLTDAVAEGSDTVTVFVVGDASDTAGDDVLAELTSQQAADVLNVSRPHVVKLAKQGVLPHRMVGNRHRFLAADIQDFRRRESARRSEVLAGLAPADGYTPHDF